VKLHELALRIAWRVGFTSAGVFRHFHHTPNIARVIMVDKVERVGRCYPAAVQAGRPPSLASHA
jgi:hypothetical protein